MSGSDKTHYRRIFDEKEPLGQGGYGIVVRATHKLDGRNCAVKKVAFTGTSSKKDKYLREVRALATLDHSNIVRYYTTWTQDVSDPKDFTSEGIGDEESTALSSGSIFGSSSGEDTVSMIIFIQMELCSSNLKQWLDDRNQQMSSPSAENIKIVMAMMREILSGLAFMHSKNFVHRDLKPTNILLQDNHIKIGDFGLVKEISDDVSNMAGNTSSGGTTMFYAVGTFPYAAPELSAGTPSPTTKSDIYSLGVTFLEMCMCVTTRHELHVNLTKLKEDQLLPPEAWYKQAQIIKTMVSGLPERRPSAEELLSNPLFTSDQVVCDQGAVKLPYTPSPSSIDSDAAIKNPVSGLYQLAERLSLKPEYIFRSSFGTSSNMPEFECTVTVGEHSFTSPQNFRRKQDAKVAVAKIAYIQLKKLFQEKRRISNQQASAVSLAPHDESLDSHYRCWLFPGVNPVLRLPPPAASCTGFMQKNRQASVASVAQCDESSDREQDGKRLSDSFEKMFLSESHGCSFSRDSLFVAVAADGVANVGPTGEKDPVSAFMEYGQAKRLSAEIVVLSQSGPPNRPVFEMAATLGERQFPAIICRTKRQGRKLAAKAALEIVEKENQVQA